MHILGVQSSLFTTWELKEVSPLSNFGGNSSALAGCMVLEAMAGRSVQKSLPEEIPPGLFSTPCSVWVRLCSHSHFLSAFCM